MRNDFSLILILQRTKYAYSDFIRPKNMLDSVVFYYMQCSYPSVGTMGINGQTAKSVNSDATPTLYLDFSDLKHHHSVTFYCFKIQ